MVHDGRAAVMSLHFFISIFCIGILPPLGYAILFHVPKRLLFPSMCVGFVCNIAYQAAAYYGASRTFACFTGACMVGFLAYFMARGLHEASTVFILPGIMPLVPGAYIYYTMTYLIKGAYSSAAASLGTTLLLAGATALGLLFSGSVLRIVTSLKRKVMSLND